MSDKIINNDGTSMDKPKYWCDTCGHDRGEPCFFWKTCRNEKNIMEDWTPKLVLNKEIETILIAGGSMSLRDYFAAKAMQAMITNKTFIIDSVDDIPTEEGTMKKCTKPRKQSTSKCYEIADAMIEERNK